MLEFSLGLEFWVDMLGVLSDFVLLFLDVGIFFSLESVLGFDR